MKKISELEEKILDILPQNGSFISVIEVSKKIKVNAKSLYQSIASLEVKEMIESKLVKDKNVGKARGGKRYEKFIRRIQHNKKEK